MRTNHEVTNFLTSEIMIHDNFLPNPYESRQTILLLARDQRILTKYNLAGNNLTKIQL
jgi:hypothetical protein